MREGDNCLWFSPIDWSKRDSPVREGDNCLWFSPIDWNKRDSPACIKVTMSLFIVNPDTDMLFLLFIKHDCSFIM